MKAKNAEINFCHLIIDRQLQPVSIANREATTTIIPLPTSERRELKEPPAAQKNRKTELMPNIERTTHTGSERRTNLINLIEILMRRVICVHIKKFIPKTK